MSLVIAAAITAALFNIEEGSPRSSAAIAAQDLAAEETKPDLVAGDPKAARAPESIDRVEKFLARVDAGDWEGSWEAAGPMFQSEASAETWSNMVEPVRGPLGNVVSRTLSNTQRVGTLPGSPEGDYEILQFKTRFSNFDRATIETVYCAQGEDGWEVVGYLVVPEGI